MEDYGEPQNSEKINLLNNGHTLQVGLYSPQSHNITGSGLPGKFTLAQLHFHWGNSSSEGSEHYVGGKAYPAEVQTNTRFHRGLIQTKQKD